VLEEEGEDHFAVLARQDIGQPMHGLACRRSLSGDNLVECGDDVEPAIILQLQCARDAALGQPLHRLGRLAAVDRLSERSQRLAQLAVAER
jgi:hypothetical protein